jgi:hypothetical protein
MRNSSALIKILQDDNLFLELIGMTAEQFSNAEDPRVQRVLKTRILVVPPFEDYKRVLEPLSRPNFRGFGLPATAMDQSKDRLANLCAVPLRAYAFSVRMAETITDFYDRILPKGTIKPMDEKLGNYAKQTLDFLDKGGNCELIETLRLVRPSSALLEWIHRECKIIPGGELSRKIATCLGLPTGGEDNGVPIEPTSPKMARAVVDLQAPVTTGAEKDRFKAFQSEALQLKTKVASKKKQTPASSILRRDTRTFLKRVAKDHSPFLATSMESYFRGFYSEDIQSAAVRIAEARFDELNDELSELGSSEEESSSEEEEEEE